MDGWRNATRVCLVMLAVALVLLTATGVWLWINYFPAADESWVRVTHRVSSVVAVVLGVVTLALVIGRRVRTGDRGVIAGLGVAVTAFAASFTGYLLPWDQLALWAVTVRSDRRGVSTVFDADVKYVVLGAREVSTGTCRFWAIAHVVLGVLVAAAVVLAWLRTRTEGTVTTEPLELIAVGQE